MEEEKISVLIRALTSDVETLLPLDVAFSVSDGVAPFVCTRDRPEGDVALVDAHSTLVAVPGHPCAGEQHQSRSVAGESQRG